MAINFPNSPTLNEIYTDSTSGFSFQWNGSVWKTYSPSSLVLNVVARSGTVSVPLSFGSNIIDNNSYAAYATYAETAGISTTSSSSTGAQINDLDLALFD